MRQILFLILVVNAWFSKAQSPSFAHEFHDTSTSELTRVEGKFVLDDDNMILYGFIKKGSHQMPVIMRTNNTGDIIWSTYPTIMNGLTIPNPVLEVFVDKYGFVYATMINGLNSNRYLWRIEISTGKIMYYKTFNQGLIGALSFGTFLDFKDYDSTTLLGLYRYQVNGSYYQRCLAKINKITGDTTQTLLVGTSYQRHGIMTDDQGNLLVWNDSILTKYNRFNTNDVLWRKNMTTTTPFSADRIDHAYLNSEGQIILLGKNSSWSSYFAVYKLNAQTGDVIWSTKLENSITYSSLVLKQMQEDDNYVYYLFAHAGVGSVLSNVYITKVNKDTGALMWLTNHPTTQVNGISMAYNRAALDFGFTCSNYISLTGYYGSSNYEPGTWFVMNIDKTTGAKLNDFTEMVNNYAAGDYLSVGKVNWSTPSRSLAYGTLNESGYNTWAHRVEFNPANGQIIKDDRINAEFSNQSYVVQLDRFGDTNYVLKQHGNELVIEARNNQDSIIWKTNYLDTGSVVVGLFDVSASYVGAVISYQNYPWLPLYGTPTVTHSRYLVFSRNTGALINTFIQTVGSTDFNYRELEVNESNMLVFYRQAGMQLMKRWSYGATTTAALAPLPSEYLKEGSLTNTVVNYDAYYYIGVISGTIYKIPKNGGANILLKVLPNIKSINDIYLKDNVLYLVGQHTNLSERIVRYDIASNTFTYDLNFSQGSIRRIVENSNQHLILAAQRNSKIHVLCIKPTTGNILWQYYADTVQYPNLKFRDLAVNDQKQVICLTGAIVHDTTHTDALINFINYYGDQLSSLKLTDSLNKKSFGSVVMSSSSNRTIVGGAWNKLFWDQSGFLNAYNLQFCNRQITQDPSNCIGIPVALHAWSGSSYQWYKNGVLIPGATSQNFTPTTSGLYNVLVTDTCSQDTLMVPYNYTNLTGVLNVTIAGNNSICAGQSQVLTATLGATYQWYLNGGLIPGATQLNYTATIPGHYNVLVTNAIGCSDTSVLGFNLNLLPQTIITVPNHPTQVCNNASPIPLVFLPAGGTLSGQNISNGTFNPAAGNGWRYFQYTVSPVGGCPATAQDSILVMTFPTQDPAITQDVANCVGTPVALHALAVNPLGYQWFLNGQQIAGATSSTYVPSISGHYNVMVTFACILDSSNSGINYTLVQPQPQVTISATSVEFCPGDTIVLSTQNALNTQWTLNGLPIPGANQTNFIATSPGTYNVQLTNASACSDTADVSVNILALNIIATSNNLPTMLCDHDAPFNVEFQPTGGVLTSSSTVGTTFNPATVNPGWHSFLYQLNVSGSCPVNVTDSLELLPSSQYILDTTVSDSLILNGQVFTQSGQYQQQLLAANGCDSLLTIFLTIDPLGIQNLSKNTIKLWPNPNNGKFQLEVPDKNKYLVRCLDNLGREIQAFQIGGQQSYQIDQFSFLAPGYYHLLLTSKDATINFSLIIE